MLRLFSNIRKTLINEGKTSRYVRYAVGEFLLIVAGILVALQIQNWNEERKLEQQRAELIAGLITDFRINLERAEASRKETDQVVQIVRSMMESVMKNDPNISKESLYSFHTALNTPVTYRPLLGRYNSAISDGSITLLDEPSVHELFIEFIETNGHFQRIRQFALENFFLGEIPALRRSVGSLQSHATQVIIPNPDQFKMSVDEFMIWMKRKENYASYENSLIMKISRGERLSDLADLAKQILTALEELD